MFHKNKFPFRVDLPLSQWNKDQVCAWLEELGLENYAADARRWVQGGAHLLASSPQELEKELGVKNPLHKKKLLLAIQALQGPQPDELLSPAGLLDTHWVTNLCFGQQKIPEKFAEKFAENFNKQKNR